MPLKVICNRREKFQFFLDFCIFLNAQAINKLQGIYSLPLFRCLILYNTAVILYLLPAHVSLAISQYNV